MLLRAFGGKDYKMREIIFDTETTGFDPLSGDRVIEIGCVEMVNKVLTGETYHVYVNPERDVPASAFKVHGISTDFLQDKALFSSVADDFLAFVGDEALLVAHNADFDMKFINWELENAGKPILPQARFKDTLAIARIKFPGASNSLDALCKRFGIDNANRTLHGALLDSEILADVYIELEGGRQAGMDLSLNPKKPTGQTAIKKAREPRQFAPSEDELKVHDALIEKLDNPIWKQ